MILLRQFHVSKIDGELEKTRQKLLQDSLKYLNMPLNMKTNVKSLTAQGITYFKIY